MGGGLNFNCCCPDSFLTVHIININAIPDDNFDIKLNGHLIGTTALSTANCKGKIFTEATDFDISRDFCAGGFNCCSTPPDSGIGEPCSGAATDCTSLQTLGSAVDTSFKATGSNTLDMVNTHDNGFGNMGRVWIGTIKWNGSNYVMDQEYQSYLLGGYNDGPGVSFSFPFTI